MVHDVDGRGYQRVLLYSPIVIIVALCSILVVVQDCIPSKVCRDTHVVVVRADVYASLSL